MSIEGDAADKEGMAQSLDASQFFSLTRKLMEWLGGHVRWVVRALEGLWFSLASSFYEQSRN
jgi:hypothetical protein